MAAVEEDMDAIMAAELAEQKANQAKAAEAAELARKEKMEEEAGQSGAAEEGSKPMRRQSALANAGVTDALGGLSLGEAEERESTYMVSDAALTGLSDIMAADTEDESLAKYKADLLGAAATGDLGDTNDPRRLVVTELRVIFEEDVPDVVYNLDTEEGLAYMQSHAFTMKEGAHYKIQISFRVNHDLIAGVMFKSKVKKGIFSTADELMLGSYAPASEPHVFMSPRFDWDEAPKGMMYRGSYSAENSFVDSDGAEHLKYTYKFNIAKHW